jgi:hypothetical protein
MHGLMPQKKTLFVTPTLFTTNPNKIVFAEFEETTAVNKNNILFLDVAPCGPVKAGVSEKLLSQSMGLTLIFFFSHGLFVLMIEAIVLLRIVCFYKTHMPPHPRIHLVFRILINFHGKTP